MQKYWIFLSECRHKNTTQVVANKNIWGLLQFLGTCWEYSGTGSKLPGKNLSRELLLVKLILGITSGNNLSRELPQEKPFLGTCREYSGTGSNLSGNKLSRELPPGKPIPGITYGKTYSRNYLWAQACPGLPPVTTHPGNYLQEHPIPSFQ